jgi:hypothetical protein
MNGLRRVLMVLPMAISLLAGGGMVDRKPQKRETDPPPAASLADVKRIFVGPLTGGSGADELRDLIIASLSASKQFIITENEEKADAVLKGAADDKVFTDTFDSQESINTHGNGGLSTGGGNNSYNRKSIYSGIGAGQNDSTHIKERKHEAYAAIRLVNSDGDVIWSTTQESTGAKFRGAGAEVAAKVAKQLALDLERSRHPAPATNETAGQPSAASPSVTVKK